MLLQFLPLRTTLITGRFFFSILGIKTEPPPFLFPCVRFFDNGHLLHPHLTTFLMPGMKEHPNTELQKRRMALALIGSILTPLTFPTFALRGRWFLFLMLCDGYTALTFPILALRGRWFLFLMLCDGYTAIVTITVFTTCFHRPRGAMDSALDFGSNG